MTAAKTPLLRALALVLALVCSTAAATTFQMRSPEQMAQAADMIFVGEVQSLNSTAIDQQAWTEVTFSVDAWVVQGSVAVSSLTQEETDQLPDSVTLSFLGGTAQGVRSLTVSGIPQLSQRQRVLVFAYDTPGLASPVVGVNQGLYTVDARGARSAQGQYLQATEEGRLIEASSGSNVDQVVQTLNELLGSGNFVPQLPDEAPETEPEGQEQSDAEPETEPNEQEESEPEQVEEPNGDPPAAQPQTPQSLAIWYAVDETGGPLMLADQVRQAATAWVQASDGAVHFIDATDDDQPLQPAQTITYGSPQLFGPDALSFTLAYEGEPTQILVSPNAAANLPAILLHELGVLIGLPEGTTGVMGHGVTDNQQPTAADLMLLQEYLTYRPEDLNRDGTVDFYDLALLAQAFGTRGVNLAADLNNDGVVNEADLELLKAAYQYSPPSESPPSQ